MGNKTESDENVSEQKQANDWILCYLVCATDQAGGYTGAILLTDNRARPIHFAYVIPLKPTAMQRILYGSTLDEHIKLDVIAQKLWQELPKRPNVVFVDQSDLIESRRITRVPTALIAKAPDMSSGSPSLSVIRYAVGPHKKDHDIVGEIVSALEGTDLLEPFIRIRSALKESLKSGS